MACMTPRPRHYRRRRRKTLQECWKAVTRSTTPVNTVIRHIGIRIGRNRHSGSEPRECGMSCSTTNWKTQGSSRQTLPAVRKHHRTEETERGSWIVGHFEVRTPTRCRPYLLHLSRQGNVTADRKCLTSLLLVLSGDHAAVIRLRFLTDTARISA